MTSPIEGISLPSFPTAAVGMVAAPAPAASPPATTDGFADALTGALEQLQGVQNRSDALAAQAATGDLRDVHDYMIAAQEAALATEMVVTLRNKAVDAFTEIMRMPI